MCKDTSQIIEYPLFSLKITKNLNGIKLTGRSGRCHFPIRILLTSITITHTRKSLWLKMCVSCLSTAYVPSIFRFKEFVEKWAPNARAPTPGVLDILWIFKPRNAGQAGHVGRIRKTRNIYRILLRESCWIPSLPIYISCHCLTHCRWDLLGIREGIDSDSFFCWLRLNFCFILTVFMFIESG